MQDFEILGAFYLGRLHDLAAGRTLDAPLLYDSRDLTTHAVIIGMTGSGKTGLGIALIEEAAIDRIPVLAIDPKGDLGNLALAFPELRAEDLLPWVNAQEAATANQSPEEFAAAAAARWRQGLQDWGQDGARIARLRAAADITVYTPGSTAGTPIALLSGFRAPPPALLADADLLRDRVQSTATGLLALLDLDGDPLSSREHILLSLLLEQQWSAGRDVELAALIGLIQQPPLQRVGVLELESFFPARERFAFAMRLNNLLAAPGFAPWTAGEPLDIGRLLHADSGQPRVSILSIAHLSDAERMFFVTLLLSELLCWVRTQPGTSSLRALLYMDELFGYLPPVANPPSKRPLLTLLKQARAYGVGLVLATQNPVDLDYKALSNAGTWFIGRLQTERDKLRVLEGLEGAGAGGRFDRQAMEAVLAGLGKRVFLMHDVHESAPVVFHTRWTLSYLAGPLTREQVRRLARGPKAGSAATVAAAPNTAAHAPSTSAGAPSTAAHAPSTSAGAPSTASGERSSVPESEAAPVLPPEIPQFFLPAGAADGMPAGPVVLAPCVLGAADVVYSSAPLRVEEGRRLVLLAPIGDGPVPVEWSAARELPLDLSRVARRAPAGARFLPCPSAASQPRSYAAWQASLVKHLRTARPLQLLRSEALKLTSAPGEPERDFRIRLAQAARVRRDEAVGRLEAKYGPKLATLRERLRRAQQAVQRETEQASQRRLDTAVSFGSVLVGALFGRKAVSAGSASRMGTAIRSAGRAGRERADVGRAQETEASVREAMARLEAEFAADVSRMDSRYDALADPLVQVAVKPKAGDVTVHAVGLAWLPSAAAPAGQPVPGAIPPFGTSA
jgi:hypothetical protein